MLRIASDADLDAGLRRRAQTLWFPIIVFEKLQIPLWAILSDIPKVGIVT